MTRWLRKEWILLSCLIAVGLLSFVGIHWTHEKDHRPTTKSAILYGNTIPSSATVSSVHADVVALKTSNVMDAHELVDMSISNVVDTAQGTTYSIESIRPQKFSPTPSVPLSVNNTPMILPTVERIIPAVEKTVQSVFTGNIFMDFYESDDQFVYAHYKSIESILYIYPLADLFTLIVGPRQLDYYKLGDNLSKHQFLKYRKRGYKVNTWIMNEASMRLGAPLRVESSAATSIADRSNINAHTTLGTRIVSNDSSNSTEVGHHTPGYPYWQREYEKCCLVRQAKDMKQVKRAPFSLYFYARLHALYHHGGMAVDFSWLHLASLPLKSATQYGVNGWMIHTSCVERDENNQGNNDGNTGGHGSSNEISDGVSTKGGHAFCGVSSILVLTQASPVSLCVMEKYEDPGFLMCLDGGSGGSGGSGDQKQQFDQQQESAQELRWYRDRHQARCLSDALTHCFATHSINNDLTKDVVSLVPPERYGEVSEPRSQSNVHSNSQPKSQSNSESKLQSNIPAAIWLGARIWSGDWRYLSPQSPMNTTEKEHEHEGVLRYFITRQQKPPQPQPQPQQPPQHPQHQQCNHEELLSLTTSLPSSQITTTLRCSPFFIYPPFQTSPNKSKEPPFDKQINASTSTTTGSNPYLSERQSNSQSNLRIPVKSATSLYALASLSCSPSFMLVGFMKAGTTFLFSSLAHHPQVLLNLKGVGFKESGAYLYDQRQRPSRMLNFPFVEPHEGQYFVYGDATVYYAGQKDVPYFMKRDNPHMKILFAVRDPVHRIQSHHRFIKKLSKLDVNELVAIAMDPNKLKFSALRALVVEYLGICTSSQLDTSTSDIRMTNNNNPNNPSATTTNISSPHNDDQQQRHHRRRQMLLTQMIDLFYANKPPTKKQNEEGITQARGLMIWSLYAIPIYHYMQVMGRENVLVVSMERLSSSSTTKKQYPLSSRITTNQSSSPSTSSINTIATTVINDTLIQEEFRRIYRFIGICPLQHTVTGFPYRSKDLVLPHHRLNNTMEERLRSVTDDPPSLFPIYSPTDHPFDNDV